MDGILNESLPLVKMMNMTNFDVSRVLIDGGSSCYIIYAKLFQNLKL